MQHSITDIIIYPVKSLGGVHLDTAMAETEGLRFDRKWMLVDKQNRFMTQREFHRMCLFRISVTKGGLNITHPDHPFPYYLPFDTGHTEERTVTIWNDVVQAGKVNDEADEWFSDLLGTGCTLVRVIPATSRKVNEQYARHGETTGFPDDFPILIIGENALADLNARLDEKLPMDRFRPNLVFSGGEPFAEDSWTNIQAGEAGLEVVKPCARCVVTTIDQQTGIAGKEPLRTLAAYRSIESKVMFGQNALVTKPGRISLGDPIRL